MRIEQMIRELRMQKRDLERAIELLEAFERDGLERRGYKGSLNPGIGTPQPGRRGRKFMTLAERRAVSERMKLYWSARKHEENQTALAQPSASNVSKQSESRPGTRP
jgi:hypothetical protein